MTSSNQGGFLIADACCGDKEFDQGFRQLMKEIFPEPESQLRPLSPDHPIWRAKHLLDPQSHPLWGISRGSRTAVIYSPRDLSCYWNQSEHSPANPAVINAIKVGQNVIDYVTGREVPADKLAVREVRDIKPNAAQAGCPPDRQAQARGRLEHRARAIPNLMDALRKPPFGLDVVLTQKELFPRDPNLIYYPLIYLQGRVPLSFPREDKEALRQHLEPGGGTLFVDSAAETMRSTPPSGNSSPS